MYDIFTLTKDTTPNGALMQTSMNVLIQSVDIKKGGSPDSNLTFYDQVVRVEKGWVEQEFELFYSLPHCHMKQGCQMSKYPIGYKPKDLGKTQATTLGCSPT